MRIDQIAGAFSNAEPRHEVFAPNAWYGGARILKQYSGWKLPLPFVVPHGINFSESFVWDAEVSSSLNSVYIFPYYRRSAYAAAKRLTLVDGCSPWLYLNRASMPIGATRMGTIAFPVHSSHNITAATDDGQYASFLSALPEGRRPVSVCMYWRDIELKRHEPYIRKGLEVITAGHMFDESFFPRLHKLLSRCQYVHTTSLGSHVFYAAAVGAKVEIDESFPHVWLGDYHAQKRDIAANETHIEKELLDVFSRGSSQSQQKKVSLQILGQQNMQRPAALFLMLGRLSLYKGWLWRTALPHHRANKVYASQSADTK
jgi:hypothetical protein